MCSGSSVYQKVIHTSIAILYSYTQNSDRAQNIDSDDENDVNFGELKCIYFISFSHRPVRMHMDLSTNMKLLGLRLPYEAHYKVWVYAS